MVQSGILIASIAISSFLVTCSALPIDGLNSAFTEPITDRPAEDIFGWNLDENQDHLDQQDMGSEEYKEIEGDKDMEKDKDKHKHHHQKGRDYAVLIAGSSTFSNYRHQARTLS